MIEVVPSSRLERDLGIDSLGRTELILRVERAFHVRMPVRIVGEVETVADLVRAVGQAHPHEELARIEAPAASLPLVPAATEARTVIEVLDWHVAQHPDRLHLTVLPDEATVVGTLSYRALA